MGALRRHAERTCCPTACASMQLSMIDTARMDLPHLQRCGHHALLLGLR